MITATIPPMTNNTIIIININFGDFLTASLSGFSTPNISNIPFSISILLSCASGYVSEINPLNLFLIPRRFKF